MAKIHTFKSITTLELPVERVLDGAKGIITGGVAVMGWDSNGDFYAASSISDVGENLLLLERLKAKILDSAD